MTGLGELAGHQEKQVVFSDGCMSPDPSLACPGLSLTLGVLPP